MAYSMDFSKGALDAYRKRASFNWRTLKVFLYSEEELDFQIRAYKEIENHPILYQRMSPTPSTDEIKRISGNRLLILLKIRKLFNHEIRSNPNLEIIWLAITDEMEAACNQYAISYAMISQVLSELGTEQHFDLYQKNLAGEIIAGFCLTEVGHGSNTKRLQTVARYDKTTNEFVLDSPNFEAAKCWNGNMGKIGTHAIVYAQLITPDQVNHGLHAFIANIRNPQTLLPYSGITIADIGEKIGTEGMDNGLIIFNEYRIPKSSLLNKLADVTDNGEYIRLIADPAKQFGKSLAVLLSARIRALGTMTTHFTCAVTAALRYAAIRNKFRVDGDALPMIDYQAHQLCLLPNLSIACVSKIIVRHVMILHHRLRYPKNDENELVNMGIELHAISAAAKAAVGWIVREGTKECMQICSDHGYLKASELDNRRNINDAYYTGDGDNHVLIQQASNWLLKLWQLVLSRKEISFPLESVNFLNNAFHIINWKFNISSVEDFATPNNILGYYQWLVCYHLKKSHRKQESLLNVDKHNSFWIKNESYVYNCKSLAIAYIQAFIVRSIQSIISKASDTVVRKVLTNLLSLYGVWNLQEHVASFYEGGYANNPKFVQLMEESILLLCHDLKDDAVALVDVIASPDFITNSALGSSDGQVYEHLEAALVQTQNSFSRPNWWMEVSQRQMNLMNKL